MGAPKQKWTEEEENALKAGIEKHGAGKWRTILKDPEFSAILCLRSNVDLKDKWRNMGVTGHGWESRERLRSSSKRSQFQEDDDESPVSCNAAAEDFDDEDDDDVIDAKPISFSSEALRINTPNRSIPRLDNLIFEAINNLKEPTGSRMTDIAMYIEDHYYSPPNFEQILSTKLKILTASRNLVKVKHRYRIAPGFRPSDRRGSKMLLLEGRQKEFERMERVHLQTPAKYQIDAEIANIRNMTSSEAATAAARAMAEAEAAMAEAEEAAKEAEIAEADAEAAHAFAEAATLKLKSRRTDG